MNISLNFSQTTLITYHISWQYIPKISTDFYIFYPFLYVLHTPLHMASFSSPLFPPVSIGSNKSLIRVISSTTLLISALTIDTHCISACYHISCLHNTSYQKSKAVFLSERKDGSITFPVSYPLPSITHVYMP